MRHRQRFRYTVAGVGSSTAAAGNEGHSTLRYPKDDRAAQDDVDENRPRLSSDRSSNETATTISQKTRFLPGPRKRRKIFHSRKRTAQTETAARRSPAEEAVGRPTQHQHLKQVCAIARLARQSAVLQWGSIVYGRQELR